MVANGIGEAVDAVVRAYGRRLVDRQPELERVLLRLRDAYARGHVAARVAANGLRYDAPIRPYRLLTVDPDDVERVREFSSPKFRHAGLVVSGDWDQTAACFEDMDVYRAYERHFENGVPWAETDFYDRIIADIEAGREQWGCTTRADFERRCEQLDALYETIAEEGYKTQAELAAGEAVDPLASQDTLKTERFKHEISVHVARDGELLFDDGRNRLSIVKLHGLDAVPVRVLRRHADWQATRDAYVRGDPAVEHLGDHPDVAALEFGSVGSGGPLRRRTGRVARRL